MKKQFATLTVAITAMTFVLAASDMRKHPVTGQTLAEDQTFTYRVLDEHSSLDPQIVEDVSGSEIVRDLFEGLYNQDADGNLVPGVALEHSLNDDKTVYTFTLRKEAKWSDDTPVTARDFVYAWRRLADPKTASPYQWYVKVMGIANAAEVSSGDADPTTLGVKAIDDHTFEVTLQTPLPYFPLTTSHSSASPAPEWAIKKHGKDWIKPENIVVNGAYILQEHVPNERSVRVRNTAYWDNKNTILEKVVSLVINNEGVAYTRFMSGELDRTEIPAGQYPKLKESHPENTVAFPRLCSYYYLFNLTDSTHPALKDKRVRQALSYAVDRKIITDNVLQGGQTPAYTFTPGATANFSVPAVAYAKMTQAERDAKAKELLAEAGYADGLEVELIYNTSEAHKKVAIAVGQMWKQKLGVKVTLKNQEWKTFLETRGNQDYQISRGGWCGDYNEASTFLDLLSSESGYNDSKYNNPQVDKLLGDAKTASDPQMFYTKIEEIIASDMPIIPVYHYAGNYLISASLKEWPVNNAEQNWYSKDLYKIAQ